MIHDGEVIVDMPIDTVMSDTVMSRAGDGVGRAVP